jgi:hypothetical protein
VTESLLVDGDTRSASRPPSTDAPPAQLFEIVAETARLAGVSKRDLLAPRRGELSVMRWRVAGMAAAYATGGWSTPQIGRAFDRHHTTVLHAVALGGVHASARFAAKAPVDPRIAQLVPVVQAAVAARVAARTRGAVAPSGRLPERQSEGANTEEHAA